MITITRLPAGPQTIHFDEYAHRKGVRAVTLNPCSPERARILKEDTPYFESTGIDYRSRANFQTQRRSLKRFCKRKGFTEPEWPQNDETVREVVCRYLERRFFMLLATDLPYKERIAKIEATAKFRSKGTAATLDDLMKRYETGFVCEKEVQNIDSRLVVERRGLSALVTAIVYYKYRLGDTSPEIYAKTGIKPPAVRILLWRLNKVYRDMQSGRPRRKYNVLPSAGRKCQWTRDRLQKLWMLRATGHTWKQVGKALGVSHFTAMSARRRYFPR